MSAIAEEAVKDCERKKFWENYYAGYHALRADPIEWAEYQDEITLWDSSLADGLEEWPNESAQRARRASSRRCLDREFRSSARP